jgi:catalase
MQSPTPVPGWLALIAIVIGRCAAVFVYAAAPQRLTLINSVDAQTPSAGPSLGHRRNHAKGICFTGEFEANAPGSDCLRNAPILTTARWSSSRCRLGFPKTQVRQVRQSRSTMAGYAVVSPYRPGGRIGQSLRDTCGEV